MAAIINLSGIHHTAATLEQTHLQRNKCCRFRMIHVQHKGSLVFECAVTCMAVQGRCTPQWAQDRLGQLGSLQGRLAFWRHWCSQNWSLLPPCPRCPPPSPSHPSSCHIIKITSDQSHVAGACATILPCGVKAAACSQWQLQLLQHLRTSCDVLKHTQCHKSALSRCTCLQSKWVVPHDSIFRLELCLIPTYELANKQAALP